LPEENPELVLAIVAPLGVDLDVAEQRLGVVLAEWGYSVHPIRLSRFLESQYRDWEGGANGTYERYIEDRQRAGNDLREKMRTKDALARVALSEVGKTRASVGGGRRAFLVRQLKTPEEAQLLRRAYGERFVLLGITAPANARRAWVAKKIAATTEGDSTNYTRFESRAQNLIDIDDREEGKEYGQNVSATFPMADFFAVLDAPSEEEGRSQFDSACRRFLSLLFSKPKVHPTNEEFLMFQAHAASYQSADRGRQVGAVIASLEGSVISVGRNDYPRVGGGVMPTASYEREEEVSRNIIGDTVQNILDRLRPILSEDFSKKMPREQKGAAMTLLRDSKLFGMNEFNRMVHAEMSALSDAAMRGVAIRNQVMFCTTFPCQNCAKHLIACGIRALYYMAPYPKSLVKDMYSDEYDELPMLPLSSPALRKRMAETDRSRFLIFTYLGVAPRRYVQLFTMPLRKLPDGTTPDWDPKAALPRIDNLRSREHERWEAESSDLLKPFRKH
jgi:cytidine deaminase